MENSELRLARALLSDGITELGQKDPLKLPCPVCSGIEQGSLKNLCKFHRDSMMGSCGIPIQHGER